MKLKAFLGFVAAMSVVLVLFYLKGKPNDASQRAREEITGELGSSITASSAVSIETVPTISERRQSSMQAASANSIEERVIELGELGMRNDAESFQKIIDDLNDPEQEIREAAVEAVLQFGDRRAIPVLKALAAQTQDAREKTRFLEAAEFLNLPSLSEIRAERGRNLSSRSEK